MQIVRIGIFKKESYFKNLGLSIGTRYQWSKNGALVQDLQLSWLVNRKVGNSWNLYTHSVFFLLLVPRPIFVFSQSKPALFPIS